MKLPRGIERVLRAIDPRHPALDDAVCQGAKHHSPSPLTLEEIEIGPGKRVHLCGTCRGNLKVYKEMKDHFDGDIPWEIRREFGNQLRAIGDVAE